MKQSSKKGAALIYVVLVSVMIIILGYGLLRISSSSHDIAISETRQEQAYLSSKSGLNYFLNVLSNGSNDDLDDLMNTVRSSGTSSSTRTVNSEVGDITIRLTFETVGLIERLRIDSTSDIYNTSATTTAFLEKSEFFGGFDFADKPFYVYDTFTSDSSDVDYGSYKGTEITNGNLPLDWDPQYRNYPDEADQYGLMNSEPVDITAMIKDYLGIDTTGRASCSLKTDTMEPYKNKNKPGDTPFENDIVDIECNLTSDTINDINATGNNDLIFDLRYYPSEINDVYMYQTLIPVTPLSDPLDIHGTGFYGSDVVYLSLEDPGSLSLISIYDEDLEGSYKLSTNTRPYPDVNNISAGDSYVYSGNDQVELFNDGNINSDNEFIYEPRGYNFIDGEPANLPNGKLFSYAIDGSNSNSIIILIDDPSNTEDLYINTHLDAWVYAPGHTVYVGEDAVITGGVIAENVIVDEDAEINGRQPAEGFLNLLGGNNVDKSWRVVYE